MKARAGLTAGVLVTLLSSGHAYAGAVKAAAFQGPPSDARVVVIPPSVQLAEITAGGMLEPRADSTAEARGHVTTALTEELQKHRLVVVPTEERLASLRALAAKRPADGTSSEVRRDALVAATHHLRAILLNDELKTRRFAPTQVVLDHLLAVGDGPGELYFFQGEIYRLRNDPGDGARAIATYRKALEYPNAPAEVHRGLGIVLLRTGDRAGSQSAAARARRPPKPLSLDLRPPRGGK